MLLETSCATAVASITTNPDTNTTEATFVMFNAGWVELDGRTAHFGRFHGKVDLDQRRLIDSYFDSEPLTPREAVVMITTEALFHAHGQLHAYANVCYTEHTASHNVLSSPHGSNGSQQLQQHSTT